MKIMKKLLIIISILFIHSISFANSFDNFSAFEQFDKQDKQEFNKLKKEAKKCINNWDFNCAEDDLDKMKKYITSKKDNDIISDLRSDLLSARGNKIRSERRVKAASANIELRDCGVCNGDMCSCTLYVNGYEKGLLFYHWNSVGKWYDITFPNHNWPNGDYNPASWSSKLQLIKCGKIDVGSLSEALQYAAKCYALGHY
jgi:hypothetical protein